MLNLIKIPDWPQSSNIQHGFFTRHGGVSKGCYNTLNCCFASQDDSKNVRENRRRAMAHINKSETSLISTVNQNSNKVVIIQDSCVTSRPYADAMVTKEKGIVLGSDSADCPIILMADEQAGVLGLVHAGWRGAKLEIIQAAVDNMVSLGGETHNIIAIIGPCIAQKSYEISQDFFDSFMNDSLENKQFFIPSSRQTHHMFDLHAFVKNKLKNSGIQSILSINIDTYTDEDFFSCRRSKHKGEADFGGNLSFIYMEE